jgi:hypothetical protein
VSGGSGTSLPLNSWGLEELLWNLHWKEIWSKPRPHMGHHLSHPSGLSYSWEWGGPQTWEKMGGREGEAETKKGSYQGLHLLGWDAWF